MLTRNQKKKLKPYAIGGTAAAAIAAAVALYFKKEAKKADGTEGTSDNVNSLGYLLKSSMQGLGTDEKLLFETIGKVKNRQQWKELQDWYRNTYGNELLDDLMDDLSSSEFAKLQEALDRLG